MAYATTADVQRKLTFLSPSLSATTKPTASQVADAIVGASDELDAALALVNYSVPVPTAATIALGVLREWAAIGAAGEVAYSLPQGSDSKHLGYRERFSVILDEIRDRSRDLPDAPRDASARLRVPAQPRSGLGASPMFTRDSLDDR